MLATFPTKVSRGGNSGGNGKDIGAFAVKLGRSSGGSRSGNIALLGGFARCHG
jgi:hypothetical protein